VSRQQPLSIVVSQKELSWIKVDFVVHKRADIPPYCLLSWPEIVYLPRSFAASVHLLHAEKYCTNVMSHKYYSHQ
jgi:hypothetical protein